MKRGSASPGRSRRRLSRLAAVLLVLFVMVPLPGDPGPVQPRVALAASDACITKYLDRELDLSYCDFSNYNGFFTQTFDGHNFTGSNLSGANLILGNAFNTNFTSADLTGASFIGRVMTTVNFTDAVVTSVNFSSTDLRLATLTGVISGGVVGTNLLLPTNWRLVSGYFIGPGANLTDAALSGLDLSGAKLTGANLTNANLTNADLRNASLIDATLTGVTWSNTICPNGDNSNASGGTCAASLLTRTPTSTPSNTPTLVPGTQTVTNTGGWIFTGRAAAEGEAIRIQHVSGLIGGIGPNGWADFPNCSFGVSGATNRTCYSLIARIGTTVFQINSDRTIAGWEHSGGAISLAFNSNYTGESGSWTVNLYGGATATVTPSATATPSADTTFTVTNTGTWMPTGRVFAAGDPIRIIRAGGTIGGYDGTGHPAWNPCSALNWEISGAGTLPCLSLIARIGGTIFAIGNDATIPGNAHSGGELELATNYRVTGVTGSWSVGIYGGVAASATPTLTPSLTPTATATIDPSITPSATATTDPSITPSATSIPPSATSGPPPDGVAYSVTNTGGWIATGKVLAAGASVRITRSAGLINHQNGTGNSGTPICGDLGFALAGANSFPCSGLVVRIGSSVFFIGDDRTISAQEHSGGLLSLGYNLNFVVDSGTWTIVVDASTPLTDPTATPTKTVKPTKTATPNPILVLTGGSSSSNGEAALRVRDGDTSTTWRSKSSVSKPAKAWVSVRLASATNIAVIRWRFGNGGIADRYSIESHTSCTAGATASGWVTRGSATRTNPTVNTWQTFESSTPFSACQVRFVFKNPNQDVRIGGLAEIQLRRPSGASAVVASQSGSEASTSSSDGWTTPARPGPPLPIGIALIAVFAAIWWRTRHRPLITPAPIPERTTEPGGICR